MSIFKETLAESIQTQLKARTLIVNGENNNRNPLLPWYLSKNAWVRMTSLTNFTSGNELITNGKGEINVVPDGNYIGDQLSKKYILEGGTLYTKKKTGPELRYGLVDANASYGGDVDLSGKIADEEYFRIFGIRPIPGIIDVKLTSKGAYGSLFETVVKFKANDTHQLNELELLFMRPGYHVLLEWGWSQYVDYQDDKLKNRLQESEITPSVFNGITINAFAETDQQEILNKLEKLRIDYRHNYDGMLGVVKNFNWKMNKDGSYDCETHLISIGETINTIKMSSNVNDTKPGFIPNVDPNGASTYIYDDYENILISLKAELEKGNAYQLLKEKGIDVVVDESEYRGSWNYETNYINKSNIIEKLKTSGHNSQADLLVNQPKYQILKSKTLNEGITYEYLSLDVWIAIVDSYFNLKQINGKNETKKPVRIIIPDDNSICLAGPDTVSVDPKVCQVKNTGAFQPEMKFLKFYGNYKPGEVGLNPPMYYLNESGQRQLVDNNQWQFYDKTRKVGKINNIFVNIDCLLSTYKQMKNNANEEGVVMIDYIKAILNKISNSLGGLNNFVLSTAGRDQNTVQIADIYYLEDPTKTKPDDKYEFDLLGLGSICKSVNIQSQIFPEQSTITAVAAQSRANLADVYNSSQVWLNAGLEDRVALQKYQGDELTETGQDNVQADPNFFFYAKLYNFILYARDYLVGTQPPGSQFPDFYSIFTNNEGEGNSSLLKQFLLKYDNDLNFKALIPFKLSITLEGIGGIVIGQIFRVKKNVLPKNYHDKNFGFVITSIDHTLNNNKWETTLGAQICILDQDKNIFKEFLGQLQDRKGFGEFIKKATIRGLLYPILVDFIEYQASRAFIGFLLSSVDSVNKQSANEFVFDEVFKKQNGFEKNSVVKNYWIDNVDKILLGGSYVKGTYSLQNFGLFVKDWAQAYLDINPVTATSTKFSEDKTLADVLKWISDKSWVENSEDPDYKQFQTDIQNITAALLSNTNIFAPSMSGTNSNKLSLYTGRNISYPSISETPIMISQNLEGKQDVEGLFLWERTFNGLKVYGFDRAELKVRIDRFINGTSYLRDVYSFYNNDLALASGQTLREIKGLVPQTSGIIYGNSKSVVLPYNVNTVNGPFTLSNDDIGVVAKVPGGIGENSLFSNPTPVKSTVNGVKKSPNYFNIITRFGNTIDWNGTSQLNNIGAPWLRERFAKDGTFTTINRSYQLDYRNPSIIEKYFFDN